MGKIYRVGTRKSPLALKQTEEILKKIKYFYSQLKIEIVEIEVWGDKDKITPISEIEGSDFFTKELDEALLERKIDFAVHSAKDLPNKLKSGLLVAALTESIDPYDVLVSKSNLRLKELPQRAKIGTSSLRRKEGLKKYRDDFCIVDIRGNIGERLEKLYNSDLDAIVIAAAGLIRLGLKDLIAERIPFQIINPHPLQGCLAVVIREDDKELFNLLSCIDIR